MDDVFRGLCLGLSGSVGLEGLEEGLEAYGDGEDGAFWVLVQAI